MAYGNVKRISIPGFIKLFIIFATLGLMYKSIFKDKNIIQGVIIVNIMANYKKFIAFFYDIYDEDIYIDTSSKFINKPQERFFGNMEKFIPRVPDYPYYVNEPDNPVYNNFKPTYRMEQIPTYQNREYNWQIPYSKYHMSQQVIYGDKQNRGVPSQQHVINTINERIMKNLDDPNIATKLALADAFKTNYPSTLNNNIQVGGFML